MAALIDYLVTHPLVLLLLLGAVLVIGREGMIRWADKDRARKEIDALLQALKQERASGESGDHRIQRMVGEFLSSQREEADVRLLAETHVLDWTISLNGFLQLSRVNVPLGSLGDFFRGHADRFTALGLFCTFLGLTMAMFQFQKLGVSGSGAAETLNQTLEAMHDIVGSMQFAFFSSVLGLALAIGYRLSLEANAWEHRVSMVVGEAEGLLRSKMNRQSVTERMIESLAEKVREGFDETFNKNIGRLADTLDSMQETMGVFEKAAAAFRLGGARLEKFGDRLQPLVDRMDIAAGSLTNASDRLIRDVEQLTTEVSHLEETARNAGPQLAATLDTALDRHLHRSQAVEQEHQAQFAAMLERHEARASDRDALVREHLLETGSLVEDALSEVKRLTSSVQEQAAVSRDAIVKLSGETGNALRDVTERVAASLHPVLAALADEIRAVQSAAGQDREAAARFYEQMRFALEEHAQALERLIVHMDEAQSAGTAFAEGSVKLSAATERIQDASRGLQGAVGNLHESLDAFTSSFTREFRAGAEHALRSAIDRLASNLEFAARIVEVSESIGYLRQEMKVVNQFYMNQFRELRDRSGSGVVHNRPEPGAAAGDLTAGAGGND
ncbi:MAG TPA: hypothetical protein VD902_11680 [Symbiobacteriaceae bacterium]|nr:hypothetical protein [Symbiobacteriaceae bacterium]